MSERKPPRFPYLAVLLCAACVGAAMWTLVSYSYRWEWTAEELFRMAPTISECEWPYLAPVQVSGVVVGEVELSDKEYGAYRVADSRESAEAAVICVVAPRGIELFEERTFVGVVAGIAYTRDGDGAKIPGVFTTSARRFHPASIAGLVVGAMGVFVFAVALRHWLGERSAFKTPDTAAPPESPA